MKYYQKKIVWLITAVLMIGAMFLVPPDKAYADYGSRIWLVCYTNRASLYPFCNKIPPSKNYKVRLEVGPDITTITNREQYAYRNRFSKTDVNHPEWNYTFLAVAYLVKEDCTTRVKDLNGQDVTVSNIPVTVDDELHPGANGAPSASGNTGSDGTWQYTANVPLNTEMNITNGKKYKNTFTFQPQTGQTYCNNPLDTYVLVKDQLFLVVTPAGVNINKGGNYSFEATTTDYVNDAVASANVNVLYDEAGPVTTSTLIDQTNALGKITYNNTQLATILKNPFYVCFQASKTSPIPDYPLSNKACNTIKIWNLKATVTDPPGGNVSLTKTCDANQSYSFTVQATDELTTAPRNGATVKVEDKLLNTTTTGTTNASGNYTYSATIPAAMNSGPSTAAINFSVTHPNYSNTANATGTLTINWQCHIEGVPVITKIALPDINGKFYDNYVTYLLRISKADNGTTDLPVEVYDTIPTREGSSEPALEFIPDYMRIEPEPQNSITPRYQSSDATLKPRYKIINRTDANPTLVNVRQAAWGTVMKQCNNPTEPFMYSRSVLDAGGLPNGNEGLVVAQAGEPCIYFNAAQQKNYLKNIPTKPNTADQDTIIALTFKVK